MTRFVLGLVVLAVVVPVRAANDEKDLEKLHGTWTAVLWKRGPGEVGKDKVATELVLGKDGYKFPVGINRVSAAGAVKIVPGKGEIDFTPGDGPAKGKTLLGIYKLDGDTLTICFASAGLPRPKELKTEDRMVVLAKYERKK